MRICVMIPGFSDGGAQIQCIRLLNALAAHADLDLHLIRFHRHQPHDALLAPGRIVIHELPSRSHFDPRTLLAAATTSAASAPPFSSPGCTPATSTALASGPCVRASAGS